MAGCGGLSFNTTRSGAALRLAVATRHLAYKGGPPEEMAMPELVFFRRGEEVLRVALERPRLVLGRAEDSDIVIPDPQVRRV